MARPLTDSLTALVANPAARPATADEARGALTGIGARLMLIAAALAGLAAGGLLALALAGPLPSDVELVRLLRGMVLIKGAIALAAATVLFRRLGRPVTLSPALGYAAGIGLTFASLAWLWGLSGLLVGSLAFYAGLTVAVLSTTRDPLLVTRPPARGSRSPKRA